MAVSPAMQRYAAEIYRLEEDHPYATLSMIADQANTSLQAVSRMINRMKKADLIEHAPYKGARLTAAGRKAALPAIRRHRLAEVFLVKVMNFGWDVAHDLTDTFEMGIDQAIEDRIDQLSDYPTRCPHGNPIPNRDGVMPELNDRSVVTLEPDEVGHISRVRTMDGEKLRYLAKLGLVPGIGFKVLSRSPFNGPMRIQVNDQEHIIGHELATILWVETINGSEKLRLCDRTGCPLPKMTASYGYIKITG